MRYVSLIAVIVSPLIAGCASIRDPWRGGSPIPTSSEDGGIVQSTLQGLADKSAHGWNFERDRAAISDR